MALPKKYRLKKQKDFDRVKAQGRLTSRALFGFLVLENQDNPFPVFGFVVSKKISPKAVKRNKIRRRLAEAVRPFLPQVRPGIKVVVLAKKALAEASGEKVKKEVAEALEMFLK